MKKHYNYISVQLYHLKKQNRHIILISFIQVHVKPQYLSVIIVFLWHSRLELNRAFEVRVKFMLLQDISITKNYDSLDPHKTMKRHLCVTDTCKMQKSLKANMAIYSEISLDVVRDVFRECLCAEETFQNIQIWI